MRLKTNNPKQIKQVHRGKTDPFYLSKAWRTMRQRVLSINPKCVHCERIGRVTKATDVDHIKPINQGGEALEILNLQGLCSKHHAIKSGKERKA